MPATVSTCSVLITTLLYRYEYYVNFIDEDTEASPSHATSKGLMWVELGPLKIHILKY